MSRETAIAKGDLFLQSKHADVSLTAEEGDNWVLFFYDQPGIGKAVVVSHFTDDYPRVVIQIMANWKAKKYLARLRKDDMGKDENKKPIPYWTESNGF